MRSEWRASNTGHAHLRGRGGQEAGVTHSDCNDEVALKKLVLAFVYEDIIEPMVTAGVWLVPPQVQPQATVTCPSVCSSCMSLPLQVASWLRWWPG